mgnify:CR=1 FL=1
MPSSEIENPHKLASPYESVTYTHLTLPTKA